MATLGSAAEIAARQHGALARAQLLEAGWSDRRIALALDRGELLRSHRGVYLLVGAPQTPVQSLWAAHLAVGPLSLVSGLSAAALHGIDGISHPLRPILVVPYADAPTRPQPGVRLVRSRTIEGRHRTEVDGLPTVCLQRLPIELASEVRPGQLAAVVREVIRRTGCTPDDLLDEAHHAGNRAGISRLRQTLRDVDPGHARVASAAESQMLALIERHGLARPVVNHPIFADDGQLVGILDFAWPDLHAAIELDSLRHHATTQAQTHDVQRQQRFERLGWRFRRITPRQVARNPAYVVRLVAEFLDQQRATLTQP